MKPEEFKQNVKDRVRVFEDGGIRLLKKKKRVDFIGIRAVELSIIIPVGRVGQVPLNERVRVNGNAHRLQQHHRADALAAVHPAFRLVDIGSRYDFFFIKIPFEAQMASVKSSRSVVS